MIVHCYQRDPKRKYRTVVVVINYKDVHAAWQHVDQCPGGHALNAS